MAKTSRDAAPNRDGESAQDFLKNPLFLWSDSGFAGTNRQWLSTLTGESNAALSWFKANNNVELPDFAGEYGKAEYCFTMAEQAEKAGQGQPALAAYHQALQYYCIARGPKAWASSDDIPGLQGKIAVTCFNLAKVYGALQKWEMARMLFLQSAYLAALLGKRKNYGWALYYLADTCDRLGNRPLSLELAKAALPVFQQEIPETVSAVQTFISKHS